MYSWLIPDGYTKDQYLKYQELRYESQIAPLSESEYKKYVEMCTQSVIARANKVIENKK